MILRLCLECILKLDFLLPKLSSSQDIRIEEIRDGGAYLLEFPGKNVDYTFFLSLISINQRFLAASARRRQTTQRW